MKASVTFAKTLEMYILSVGILDQSVQTTIGTAGYGNANEIISKNQELLHNPGIRFMGIWHPNCDISSGSADESMRSTSVVINREIYRGRPATFEELASYERDSYETLGDIVLVALGEKISSNPGDSEFVAFRSVSGSMRLLNLTFWTAV